LKNKIDSILTTLDGSNGHPSPDQVQQALVQGLIQAGLMPSGSNLVVTQPDSGSVQFDMLIDESYQLADVPLAADFGIPGLGLHIDPGTHFVVTLPLKFAFGFGYSKTDGLYLDTDAVNVLNQKLNPSPNLTDTFTIGLDAALEGLNATGTLGFL